MYFEKSLNTVINEAQEVLEKHQNLFECKSSDVRQKIARIIDDCKEKDLNDSHIITAIICLMDQLDELVEDIYILDQLNSVILNDISQESFLFQTNESNQTLETAINESDTLISNQLFAGHLFELVRDLDYNTHLFITLSLNLPIVIKIELNEVDLQVLNNALKSSLSNFLQFLFKNQKVTINSLELSHTPKLKQDYIYKRLILEPIPEATLSRIGKDNPDLVYMQEKFRDIDLTSHHGQYLLKIFKTVSEQRNNHHVMESLFSLYNMYPTSNDLPCDLEDSTLLHMLSISANQSDLSLHQETEKIVATNCIDAYINGYTQIANYFYNLYNCLQNIKIEQITDILQLYFDNNLNIKYEHTVYSMTTDELEEIANLFLAINKRETSIKGFIIKTLQQKLVELKSDFENQETLKLIAVIIDTVGLSIPQQNLANFSSVSRIISEYCQQDFLSRDEAIAILRNKPDLSTTKFIEDMLTSLVQLSGIKGFPYLRSRQILLSALQDSPRRLSTDIQTFITDTLFKNL